MSKSVILALRRFLPLAGLIMLCGCNMVVSEEPWFADADAVDAPVLRDGLWISTKSSDCEVDKSQPPETWPECAVASKMAGNRWLTLKSTVDANGNRRSSGWRDEDILLVAGKPAIVQYKLVGEGQPEKFQYAYIAIRPLRLDARERIVAFKGWIVSCGPLSGNSGDEGIQHVSQAPFEGLSVIDGNCTAKDVQALRRAASLSEGLSTVDGPKNNIVHWVRD